MNLYRALEIPAVYNLVQAVFGSRTFSAIVRRALQPYAQSRVLELGSGTGAFTQTNFPRLVASDINRSYLDDIPLPNERKRVMDASQMDILSDYDMVYSVGLYHHLDDNAVRSSLKQTANLLVKDGRLIVIDNIWPTTLNPVAYMVRRFDRGGHVRSLNGLKSLISEVCELESCEIGTYSWCNLEYAIIKCRFKTDD